MDMQKETERLAEYTALRQEFEPPPELSGSVARAEEKAQKRRWKKRMGRALSIPAAALASVFLAVVLAVNASPALAYSVGQLPGMKHLARAVASSPSLKAAVDNRYVQPVGESMTNLGITVTVEYVIVDKKNINVFYSVSAKEYPPKGLSVDFAIHSGPSSLPNLAVLPQSFSEKDEGRLNCFSLSYIEDQTPDKLMLEFKVKETAIYSEGDGENWDAFLARTSDPQYLSRFIFDIPFDPDMVDTGRSISIGQWLEMDGQRLYLDSLELYPSLSQLNLKDDPQNSAWLRGFYFYMEDGEGNKYRGQQYGWSSSGLENFSPSFADIYFLESSYFSEREDYTLFVEGGQWLDKDRQIANIDLTAGLAEGLPEGICLEGSQKVGVDSWEIVLSGPSGNGAFHPRLSAEFLDPLGESHYASQFTRRFTDAEGEEIRSEVVGGRYVETFLLEKYPYGRIAVKVDRNRESSLFGTPISIALPTEE